MARKIRFKNELILHLLTQKHLKKCFGLECVASEIQHKKQRFDNLAFDEKTNSFVIIEYKNRLDAKVLKQAQDYRDLLLKNKDNFLKRLENPKNVNFDKTRVMIISPEFSEEQIRDAKCNFELWQVTLYDDCCVEYKQLKTNEIKKFKVSEDELKLTEKDLLKNRTDEIRSLYHALRNRVENEFGDAECRILVDAVSFKICNRIICNVRFLKKSFNVYFFSEILADLKTDEKHKYDLKINSEDDLNQFMKLFKQVYNEKVKK